MDNIELREKIAEILLGIINSKLQDSVHKYLEDYKGNKNVERLNDKISHYVDEKLNEDDREQIIEYIVKSNPVPQSMESIFNKEEFINGFYARNIGISKSEIIDRCMANVLDIIEQNLNLSTKDKLEFKQFRELKEILYQIKQEKYSEKEREEKLLHCIRVSIPYKNDKLCNKICKMYVNVKKNEYIDEIDYLKSKISGSWKKSLLDILKYDKAEKLASYNEKVNHIREKIEYDEIYKLAEAIYLENDWEGENGSELRNILKNKKYDKVYVLVGNQGAGKTFFIKTLFQKMKEEAILLNISIYDLYENNIESLIVKNFTSTIGEKCYSIDEVCEWGNKLNYKICIIIENIQGLYYFDKHKFEKLIDEIQDYTKYDLFSWVVTTSEQDFYILRERDDFLKHYCFGNRKAGDSFVQNAFNLNDYNDNHNIVHNIFNMYKLSVFGYNDEASQLIREPLYAHIIGCFFNENNKIQFPETYFQLVVEINKIMDKRIEDIDGDEIRLLEKEILRKLCDNKQLYIKGEELSGFKTQISELSSIQLLTIIEEVEEDIFSLNYMKRITKICLKTEIYWALKIVIYYINEYNNSFMIITQLLKYDNSLQILMISIYLNRLTYLNTEINSVFNLLFKRKKGAYILYGTRNSNKKYDQIVYSYLKNNKIKSDYYTTYALLYFIYYSRLSIDDKIYLITQYAAHINNINLLDVYENVVKHIAYEVYSVDKLMECFLILATCRVNNINAKNGYVFGNKYKELKDKMYVTFEDSIKGLFCFIKCDQKNFAQINFKDSKRNIRNDSFVDYFIRAVFENYIEDNGVVNIWERCHKAGIFSQKNTIGKTFRRNFTCGAGNVFNRIQKDSFRKDYENLIYKLVKDEQNKFTAMFLIINTIQVDRPQKTWDNRLLEPFLILWSDKNIRSFFSKTKEVDFILKECKLK